MASQLNRTAYQGSEGFKKVFFDVRAGNSNLAKSLSKKNNDVLCQDENPDRDMLSLHNYL